MAIYHLNIKTISRSTGRSATAAAAYRAGVEIADQRTGEIHDYRRKGGVESAELILPAGAPAWAGDRAALWNAAEHAETRKNSTVAREFEIALPAELSAAERRRLAHDFAREIVARHQCAADVALHAPGRDGDHRNHHAHILVSTRRLTATGFGAKTRELDDRKTGEVARWRERFASLQNERLRGAGIDARIDHRSLEDQGIDRVPTQHQGPAVAGMTRRGVSSEVGRRMADEAETRRFAAREVERIERALAQVQQRIEAECERSAGRERSGPAIQAARFRGSDKSLSGTSKPGPNPSLAFTPESSETPLRAAESHETYKPLHPHRQAGNRVMERLAGALRPWRIASVAADLDRIDRNAPIEQQAKALETLVSRLAAARKARLDRTGDQASDRQNRRAQAARRVWEAQPQAPTGLLARFRRASYETALAQWRKDLQRADRLREQAEQTRNKIRHATLYGAWVKGWAWRELAKAAPELAGRVEAQREAERQRARERAQSERQRNDHGRSR